MRILLINIFVLTSAIPVLATQQYCTEATITYDTHGVGTWSCKTAASVNNCQYCGSAVLTQNDNSTTQTWKCTAMAGDCGSCFSKETTVFKADSKNHWVPTSINSLQNGDIILDGDGKATEFLGYLHADADAPAVMLEFYEQENAKEPFLTVSPEHLLFVDGLGTKFAGDVKLGQFLTHAETGTEIFVAKINPITSGGIYAPLTESGTIAVGPEKIKASCFAHVNSPTLSSWYFYMKRLAWGEDFLKTASPSWTDQTILSVFKRIGFGR